MTQVHLLLGPVGAGKSTLAQALVREHGAVWLELDAWMARLFRADRPDDDAALATWYSERAARCEAQIWATAEGIVAVGTPVVLELGLLERRLRERVVRRVERAGWSMTVHIVRTPRDLRWERVVGRNRDGGGTAGRIVSEAIFAIASDRWEPVEGQEVERFAGAGIEVVWVDAEGVSGAGGPGAE